MRNAEKHKLRRLPRRRRVSKASVQALHRNLGSPSRVSSLPSNSPSQRTQHGPRPRGTRSPIRVAQRRESANQRANGSRRIVMSPTVPTSEQNRLSAFHQRSATNRYTYTRVYIGPTSNLPLPPNGSARRRQKLWSKRWIGTWRP